MKQKTERQRVVLKMMKEELTQREKEVFDYIYSVKMKYRVSPKFRDIQKALGFKSVSTVQTIIDRLRDKGYLTKSNVSDDGSGRKKTNIDLTDQIIVGGSNQCTVPVIGEIAAGKPILAAENHLYYIDYPRREGNELQYEYFGLIVKGNSMIEAGIMNGDIVIVAKTMDVANGEIVAAMIEGEATVKRFFKENGHYRLQPENREYEPIITDELGILGKVVSVVRYYT